MSNDINGGAFPALADLSSEPLRVAVFSRSAIREGMPDCLWQMYEQLLCNYPNWTYIGCYRGRGATEKNEHCLGGLPQMLAECEDGNIDLIITKSTTDISRDIFECIATIRALRALSPPVGIYFEHMNMLSLHSNVEYFLAYLSFLATQESENKSGWHGCVRMMPMHSFGLLRNARRSKGLTQQAVADIARIGIRQYRRYENGERSLYKAPFRIGNAICSALDIKAEELSI